MGANALVAAAQLLHSPLPVIAQVADQFDELQSWHIDAELLTRRDWGSLFLLVQADCCDGLRYYHAVCGSGRLAQALGALGTVMPESPQIFRVTVQVTDTTAAARFYSSLLGIEGRSIRGARHYFDCGPVILALVDPGDGSARPNPDDIYFSVTDLDAAHARASQLRCLAPGLVHGAPAGSIVVRPWGERSFLRPCRS